MMVMEASQHAIATQQRDAGLQDFPDAEWYLWIDSDTIIIDVAFTLPFWNYEGKDLVIWGNETRMLSGDGRRGESIGCCCGYHAKLQSCKAWQGALCGLRCWHCSADAQHEVPIHSCVN